MLNTPQPFFWNKLSNAKLGSTVWSELGSPDGLVLDMKELEDTFTVDNSSKSTTSQTASAFSLNKKQTVTTLLDITRANNVGECSSDRASNSKPTGAIAIMLARMKLHQSDIKKALLEVDDNRLSTDDLKAISKQLPSQDEVSRIRDFGDVSKLAKADQYFAEVC